jgi:hypothetical protein
MNLLRNGKGAPMAKKPLYFRQINNIEVLVYQKLGTHSLEVKFRRKSNAGRMVSVFGSTDMDILCYLANDIRNLFGSVEVVTSLETSQES